MKSEILSPVGGQRIMHSIILTVHDKGFLIEDVMQGIYKNTVGDYELIVVLDGCNDNSEEVVNRNKTSNTVVIYTDDVFETKANNAGLRIANGEHSIIVQDDMLIREQGWNMRMQEPFVKFNDVFAVTSRTACNVDMNHSSSYINMEEDIDTCWSDILSFPDAADNTNSSREQFHVRSVINRGPLMIDSADLKKLGYLDEAFAPQDLDDVDLCLRSKVLGKVVGSYWIDWYSQAEWGGTRVNGHNPTWLLKSNHKNSKLIYNRHKDVQLKMMEDRDMS